MDAGIQPGNGVFSLDAETEVRWLTLLYTFAEFCPKLDNAFSSALKYFRSKSIDVRCPFLVRLKISDTIFLIGSCMILILGQVEFLAVHDNDGEIKCESPLRQAKDNQDRGSSNQNLTACLLPRPILLHQFEAPDLRSM